MRKRTERELEAMKTKSIILALFAIVFVCGQVRAQDDLPYRPFKSFNNDTIQYIDYNFLIRGEQYAGKKISELINDLELPILSISQTVEISTGSNVANIVEIDLLVGKEKPWSSSNYYVNITLVTPIPDREYIIKFVENDEGNEIIPLTSELYEQIKDRKIKNVTSNSYLIEERRKLIEMHTKEANEQLKKVIEAEKANWRKKIREERQAVNN